jgi:hypothetical protein
MRHRNFTVVERPPDSIHKVPFFGREYPRIYRECIPCSTAMNVVAIANIKVDKYKILIKCHKFVHMIKL